MENSNYCFCTLALGKRYQEHAVNLAQDLTQYAPTIKIVVYTDGPDRFSSCENVLPFYHRQKGILNCFHDKRFALEKALSLYSTAIFIDADTRVSAPVPEGIAWEPGITSNGENLQEHISRFAPERLAAINDVSQKMDINLSKASWIADALFAVSRGSGKEHEFFDAWGRIGLYMELKGIHAGQGNVTGLAAESVGWKLNSPSNWEELRHWAKHFDASKDKTRRRGIRERVERKLGYYARLSTAKVKSLKDFDFYYR
ncbi:MAG: hypothetical protein AAF889_14410 [Cyanobacteria bacterium P01_D01_bin.73]